MRKKISAFMAILFVLSTIFSVNVFAASNIKINGVDIGYAAGQYFSKNGKACTCHNQNKCVPEKSGCNCKHVNGTAQCYAFALWCENKLFGYNDVSQPSKFKNLGSVAAGSLTASKIKDLINSAPLGSHIRTNGLQHSMVLMSKTSKGFTVAQANGSNNNEYSSWSACRIGTATYTWQSYVSSTYGKRGIAFIKAPKNAPTVTAPSKPVISSVSATGDTEITIKWKAVSGAEKYILQGRKSGESYETIAEITGTSYTQKRLKTSSLYWYRLKAKNSAGTSAYSDANGAYTKPTKPTVSTLGTTSVEVKWSKSGGNTTYDLLVRKSGDDGYKTIAKNLTGYTYTHKGLQAGSQFDIIKDDER